MKNFKNIFTKTFNAYGSLLILFSICSNATSSTVISAAPCTPASSCQQGLTLDSSIEQNSKVNVTRYQNNKCDNSSLMYTIDFTKDNPITLNPGPLVENDPKICIDTINLSFLTATYNIQQAFANIPTCTINFAVDTNCIGCNDEYKKCEASCSFFDLTCKDICKLTQDKCQEASCNITLNATPDCAYSGKVVFKPTQ